LTQNITSTQVVETSVTNNSSFQNYPQPDDDTTRTTDTPGFKPFTKLVVVGEQGWHRGESACLPPIWPGSIPAWCHMWVEFVVGCGVVASRVFLQVLQLFLHPEK